MAFTELKSVGGLRDPLTDSHTSIFFLMHWVATPLFYVRYRCHAGTEQASAVDKSAISANNTDASPGASSDGLLSKGPETDVPQKFTVNNEYACSWSCMLMRSLI
jgi:hypothetical protein